MIDWILAHPELVVYVVVGIVTFLVKPRTEEQYAKLPPRVAAFLKLLGALGIDPRKVGESVKQVIKGK